MFLSEMNLFDVYSYLFIHFHCWRILCCVNINHFTLIPCRTFCKPGMYIFSLWSIDHKEILQAYMYELREKGQWRRIRCHRHQSHLFIQLTRRFALARHLLHHFHLVVTCCSACPNYDLVNRLKSSSWYITGLLILSGQVFSLF